MTSKYKENILYGLKQEKAIHTKLEGIYGKLETTDYWSPIDFKNENYMIELKSRRIKHNQYKTLIFGKNKLNYFLENRTTNEKFIVIWRCLDGDYMWEYRDDCEYVSIDDLIHIKTKDITLMLS